MAETEGSSIQEVDDWDGSLVPQEAWNAAQAAIQERYPDMPMIEAALLSTVAVRAAAPFIAAVSS